MDICIDLNIILILALIAALVVAGVILYPLLFSAKKTGDGDVKMGFIPLWIKRIKALLTGKARIDFDIDWDVESEEIKNEE